MSSQRIKRIRLIATVLTTIGLTIGTIAAIYFAKGYRPNFKGKTIEGTGLLAASSYPKQAAVYIDNKLTTTTDDTINLIPGQYQVRIALEGFIPWEKTLKIEKELVTSTNTRLFPAVPSLSAFTTTGAALAEPSPDGTKIAYLNTQALEPEKNGLYVLSTASNPLGFDRKPTQIVSLRNKSDFPNIQIAWSPDTKQILLVFTDKDHKAITGSYLLNPDTLNNISNGPDVTIRLPFIFSSWEEDLARREQAEMKKLPDFMLGLATQSAINVFFSPDGEKMLYTATQKTTIPDRLIPPLASINSTPQVRTLEPQKLYVYDLKEDTNYLLGNAPAATTSAATTSGEVRLNLNNQTATQSGLAFQTLQKNLSPLQTILAFRMHYNPLVTGNAVWYPTSRHLISARNNKLTIFEYDNTNQDIVYSGPFDTRFYYPSTNGSRLFILTNLNQDLTTPFNLYTLDLK